MIQKLLCLVLLVAIEGALTNALAGEMPAAMHVAQAEVEPADAVLETAPPEIKWRVENPFRFFGDPVDVTVHRATYDALSAAELDSPILSAERALASRHTDGWAAAMAGHVCWDSDRNRHKCPDGKAYIKPESHTIIAEVSNVRDAALVECTWLTAPKGGKKLRGQSEKRMCDDPIALSIPYPHGAMIEVEVGGRKIAATTVEVEDLFIVGMGDSFGSGEGNPDEPVRFSRERTADYGASTPQFNLTGYPARVGSWQQIGDAAFMKANARWLDQACHRSLYSHQLRVALQLAIEDPHRAVTYAGFACSGAEITRGLFLRYKGNEWVPNPPDLSQISAVAVAQCEGARARERILPEAYHIKGHIKDLKGGLVLRKCDRRRARRIDLVLLSIGGNDIGFARLLANAVLSDKSKLKTLGGWLGQVYGSAQAALQLNTLDERYKALNRALHYILHVPWQQSDRIILTGYPGMALLGDGRRVCPSGRAGMEVASDFNLSAKRAKEGLKVADKLHAVMGRSARRHGWSFVQSHRRLFNGRGICAGFKESSFSVADDLRLPRRIDGKWVPFNPAEYRPYTSRQRWFRTPNDAFMTGNFHVSRSLAQKVLELESFSYFQLLLASTYSGAFHPTAEGHAAIADAVAETARAVLRKYGQGG